MTLPFLYGTELALLRVALPFSFSFGRAFVLQPTPPFVTMERIAPLSVYCSLFRIVAGLVVRIRVLVVFD